MRSLLHRLQEFRQRRHEEHSRAVWHRFRREAWQLALQVRSQSMLHEETLLALALRAQEARGAVLEIGAYTGAATVMLAKGVEASGRASPVVTIEVGGAHDHPDLPSKDIIADLNATLARYGLSRRVTVVQGRAAKVLKQVEPHLAGEKIGLLFIDADGLPERDFAVYRPLLRDDAVVAIDDYTVFEGEAKLKEDLTRPWVDAMVERGAMRPIGIYPWGTWFGRLTG